jgi:tRNA (cmo5U34)-methyltransferase
MEHGDPLAEARPKTTQRLRCQRDLRDEDDRPAPTRERRLAGADVDLGLAAARCTPKESVAPSAVEELDDPGEHALLRLRQRRGRPLGREGACARHLSTLAAPLRVVRRDERERPRRRRAVVVGEPEREVDERRRQRLGDPLDRRGRDSLRRRDADLRHDAPVPRVAEAHHDDGAFSGLLGDLVRERTRDRARGHERIDGREPRHRPRVSAAPVGPTTLHGEMSWDWDPDTYPEVIAEIPAYEELQEAVLAATRGLELRRVLELGTGTGETALRILASHPDASWTGIDSSEAMLVRARERLPGADLHVARLEEPLPAGPFDLVVSALAVHHLDADGKRDLFARIGQVTDAFVLGDLVVPERPEDATMEIDGVYDIPSSVPDHLEWLDEAGFETEVRLVSPDLAVFRSLKPR